MNSRLVIGPGSGVDHVNPFIALMHDDVPPEVMFPTHPHHGVEIITYGISGALYHEDTLGNRGTVVAGGVERNLFARGFAHSEQPVGGVPYRGFQLFIALTEADRRMDPSWQIIEPDDVPTVTAAGLSARVIAGAWGDVASPLVLRNPVQYLDVRIAPGGVATVPVPEGFDGIAYTISGVGTIGTPPVAVGAHQRLRLGDGDSLHVATAVDATEPMRVIIIAGQPIT